MIRSTTSILQDRKIEEYLGVVVGEAILGANIFKDLFGAVRDVVGGRAAAYEDELAKARDIAFREAEENARDMGANAIIGIDLDYEMVKGTMMMVSVTGTAVKVADEPPGA